MPELLVCGHQHFVASSFSAIEKFAVVEVGPAEFESGIDLVIVQMPPERRRRALVEQDSHAGGDVATSPDERGGSASANDRTSKSRTALTLGAATPGNQSRNWSIDAPSLMFSNSVATGTRVPRNTQAPLSLPGCRSTAEHLRQSVIPYPASWRDRR